MRSLIFVAAAFFVNSAHADTYTYVCKDHGKSYPLKLDGEKNTLAWKGGLYKTKDYENGEGPCAKFGMRVEMIGASIDFCTATQGVAWFEQAGKDIGIQCDQILFNNEKVIKRR